MLVFVYGTLKRGWGLAAELAGQRFVGEARTVPEYRMHNLGSYPGLVHVGGGGDAVEGELWEVTPGCLARLDAVEGVAEKLYARMPVTLMPPHAAQEAQVYLYLGDVAGCPACGIRW